MSVADQGREAANLPNPTTDLARAKVDMDAHGYCLLAEALSPEEVETLRTRAIEQLEAEEQVGHEYKLADNKQLVKFLFNKGQAFRDILTHAGLREIVGHVLGDTYLLSSYNAHFARPQQKLAFHTDQFWMPPPTDAAKRTRLKPGSITRGGHRGHHVHEEELRNISPACVCNAMWMLDDFTETNGATVFVPGSHLSGREPDHSIDTSAQWVKGTAPAGTVAIFEGRTWHSTGENSGETTRIGLTTNFCAPQFRQQENFLLGTRPEVLETLSEDLLALIGFKPWMGYGGYEYQDQVWVKRGEYALGEMKPK